MGRYFTDEFPHFKLEHGRIRFSLDGCIRLKNEAIDRACQIHSVPSQIVRIKHKDPWLRAEAIGKACRASGVSLALNKTTIIGQSITSGCKSEFWQKALPVLFEMVCFEKWSCLIPSGVLGYDALFGSWKVDFKCKHRNVPPHTSPRTYIATVPVSQRNQTVDFYCFGQMEEGMNVGYINGVLRKSEFVEKCHTKEEGDVDSNGETYVDPADAVFINDIYGWMPELVDRFLPFKYRDI